MSEVTQPSADEVAVVEALLFASGEALSAERIAEAGNLEISIVEQALAILAAGYAGEASGIEMVQVAEKFQLRTKGVFSNAVRELKSARPRRLSAAALETLAIVAYRQPIVKSDIERIRGVDVTPTLKTLLERSLVKIVGHQSTVGLPALYGTTEEFLKLFGLNNLAQLPTLRDLKEIELDPGETEEIEARADETEPQEIVTQ